MKNQAPFSYDIVTHQQKVLNTKGACTTKIHFCYLSTKKTTITNPTV